MKRFLLDFESDLLKAVEDFAVDLSIIHESDESAQFVGGS